MLWYLIHGVIRADNEEQNVELPVIFVLSAGLCVVDQESVSILVLRPCHGVLWPCCVLELGTQVYEGVTNSCYGNKIFGIY